MNYERVGKKIEGIRNLRGYTQTYMAKQLGIKQNTYSLWEKGKGLTDEGVEAIAKILQVPAEELTSPAPFAVVMNNNHGNNGNVNVENQQQHILPPEVMERLMARYEVMNDKLIALIERLAPKK